MFPAYNDSSKETNKKTLFPVVSDDYLQSQIQNESRNKPATSQSYSSFKPLITETASNLIDQTRSLEVDIVEKEEHKKKKKKRDKESKKHNKKYKKKKKRVKDSTSESESSSKTESSSSEDELKKKQNKKLKREEEEISFQYKAQSYKNAHLEKILCDENYNSYYSKFTREQLKSFQFYEDLPSLEPRNAFKLDKKGDRNNICFDQVNFKYLSKYYVPYMRGDTIEKSKSNKNAKLTKKQLRKKILNEAREKRYYTKVKNLTQDIDVDLKKKQNIDVADLSKSTLSNKMWLYLEMKSELEREYETTASNKVDKTSDYMKYLDEHKNDIEKWLEFIDYQTNKTDDNESSVDQNSFILYERKMAIFDKAIQQNTSNFRLKLERLKFKSSSFEILNNYNALEIIENDYLEMLINESSNIILKSLNQSIQNEILSNLFEIWFEYLKFLTNTNSSSITFNKIKRTYQKCFEYFLSDSSNELIRKNSNSVFFFNSILQLLDNYCNFLCKNGYIEKVIGIYQALIDFNFNSFSHNPKSPYNNMDFKFKKTLFELFWDTGLPKFGEKHSIGWLNCLENRDKIFKDLENDDELTKSRYDDQLDLIESQILTWQNIRVEYRWYEIERLRSLINWYPFYPQIVLGESLDDCADQDRLISFEDDLNFVLFDLNNLTLNCENRLEKIDNLKFKLFCKLLKTLNLISWNEECLNLNANKNQNYISNLINSSKIIDDEDIEYMRYLNEQIDYLNDEKSLDRQDIQFCGSFNFLHNLLFNLSDPYESNNFRSYTQSEKEDLKKIIKSVLYNTIEFIRNCFNQIKDRFQSSKFKTNTTVLKWKFELTLINLFKNISQNDDKFNHKILKQNLLDEAKQTLSSPENRTNFDLWKQYGILKWLLNHETQSSSINLKDTRKVFDNLLNTINNSIDIYSLCSDYVQLELGIYFNQYDVNTSNLDDDITILSNQTSPSTISIQNGFFNLKQETIPKIKNINMINLIELLVTNCSNRSSKQDQQTKLKDKVTFKIGMTGTTKLLLAKRDFQTEYELVLNECKTKNGDIIKLFHFHKVYSLFLLCTNDFEKLIEINDKMVIKEKVLNLYQSMVIEFYLNILNYLYFQEKKLNKFIFKTKLFTIIRATLSTNNNFGSFLRLLHLTLLRLKLQNSSLFCSSVLENNDIDLMFNKIALKLSNSKILSQQVYSSSFSLTLIYSHLNKLNEIIKKTNSNENDTTMSLFSSDIQQHGHQNKIRRLFDEALKLNPRSIQLWSYYFKFEFIFIEQNKFFMNKQQLNNFQNRILYIYYQSIRNLPYCKVLYINGIKCIPEKYIEVMNLMSNRELRLYFPVQELNMLLEPIKRPGELEIENDDDEIEENHEIESLASSPSTSSQIEKSNEENEELIDSNDEEKTNDSSSISSKSSVSNFDLKDF